MKQFLERARTACHGGVKALTNSQKPYYIQNLIAAFVIAFITVTSLFMITSHFSGQPKFMQYEGYMEAMNVLIFLVSVLALTVVMVTALFMGGADRVLPLSLVVSVTLFCSCLQDGGNRNIWLAVGIGLASYLSCLWLFNRFESPFGKIRINDRFVKITVSVLFVLFVGALSFMSICRYRSFTYDTFDFGIFMQMFDGMKETGLPITTVERNVELSHFAVHFSPFFYVLLPGYYLFPCVEYLCVMQVLFVGLGVFAVYGIAKALQFSPKANLMLCTLYLLYPSMSFGLFFDFHENKFLTFCLLFAVYFLLKRKYIPFYVFAILLCSVKEDAAIYLIAIALFMIVHEKLIKHGLITLVLGLGFFVFALWMIQVCGASESMEFGYRYSSFALEGEASIGSIVKTGVFDFGYAFTQLFQSEKVEFLLWMFLPVLFTPFMSKKISTLLLILPMILVNLLTNWPYQYDVDYQYTFGVGAAILVAAILALKRLSAKKRNLLITAAVMTCFAITLPRVTARCQSYIEGYFNRQEMFDSSIAFIDETLDKESVIGVEGNVMPHLHDYPHLVLDPHDDGLAMRVEYYIAKCEDGDLKTVTVRPEGSRLHDFEFVAGNDYLEVYKNPDYPLYVETVKFIEETVPHTAAVGTKGDAFRLMPASYKDVEQNPHYDDLLIEAEYYIVMADDYSKDEITHRGYEFIGERGYAAIFKNPDYSGFIQTVNMVESTIPAETQVGVRGNVRRHLSAEYKNVHHDLPMDQLGTTVEYYVANVGEVNHEELKTLGFELCGNNERLVLYRNTMFPKEEQGNALLWIMVLCLMTAAIVFAVATVPKKRRKPVQTVETPEEDVQGESAVTEPTWEDVLEQVRPDDTSDLDTL